MTFKDKLQKILSEVLEADVASMFTLDQVVHVSLRVMNDDYTICDPEENMEQIIFRDLKSFLMREDFNVAFERLSEFANELENPLDDMENPQCGVPHWDILLDIGGHENKPPHIYRTINVSARTNYGIIAKDGMHVSNHCDCRRAGCMDCYYSRRQIHPLLELSNKEITQEEFVNAIVDYFGLPK